MRLLKEIAFAAALTAASFCTMVPAESHHAMIGDLMIEHPWSRETTANADVAAGFMSITNNGTEDDELIKATAKISDMT